MSDNNVERVLPLVGTVILPINTFTYVFSELWGTISVSFLVWGYVNQITPKEAARRYYAVLGIGGQFGSFLGGVFVDAVTHSTKKRTPETFVKNMMIVNLVMAAMCVLFAAAFAVLEFYVMKQPQYAVKKVAPKKTDEPKMTVGQAFGYCLKNKYVLALCGMVFAYGFVMVLGELTYKDLMKLSFDGEQNMYASFKAKETSFCAIVAIILMIFVGHNVIRLCGWLTTALMAPVIAGILTLVLYCMALCGGQLFVKIGSGGDAKYFKDKNNAGYLDALKYVGFAFAVATKSVKYSSFDPAKELAFLSLNSEQKYKAKAAVDIIGARFGKGGGALFNILILNIAFSARVSYLKPCLVASLSGILFGLVLWIWSDVYINAHKEEVANANKKLAMAKAAPLESVQIEGGAKTTNDTDAVTAKDDTGAIEMSTKTAATVTEGN
jgi:AAA family ATP:ADP antiporter